MAQIDLINGLVGELAVKSPCKVATTANITLSGAQTIDGVLLTADASPRQRVLVKDQTVTVENGIYDVNSGTWTRSPDFDGSRDIVRGTIVSVTEGHVGVYEVMTADPITVGTTSITFALASAPSVGIDTVYEISTYSNNLATAVTAIGVNPATLLIDRAITENTSVSIPATLVLWFINPGKVNGTGTLAFAGSPDAQIKALPGQQTFGASLIVTSGVPATLQAGWFGFSPTATAAENAAAFNRTINAMNANGGKINIATGKYTLAATDAIDVPVTIDFNDSIINADTAGVVFDIDLLLYVSQTVIIKNAYFLKEAGDTDPANLIKISHENNIILENIRTYGVTVTHSYIYSYTSVALTIRNCVFETGTAPYAMYFKHTAGSPTIYTTSVDLDHIRIGDITGGGIYSEAVDITIRGKSVIERCSAGGILFPNPSTMISITDSYFEINTNFDIHFSNNNPNSPTISNIKGCNFLGAVAPVTKIKVNAGLVLTSSGNYFEIGGINGDAAPLSYVGINNKQGGTTAGYTAGPNVEIADAIRTATAKTTIITGNGIYSRMKMLTHDIFPSINSVGGTGVNSFDNGNIVTLTMAQPGALISVSTDNAGDAALFFVTYKSATIIELADPSTAWAVTDIGSGFCIYKSADSYTVTLKNYNATQNININVLGYISGAAFP